MLPSSFWDERYAAAEYVYGKQPNAFFQQQLDRLPAGRLLMPAEGEGRNAVYAATRGWEVSAFDQSAEGKKKAEALAAEMGTALDYRLSSVEALPFLPGQFDAIGLIYAHFPADRKAAYHARLLSFLKPGGWLIFEAFSKRHPVFQALNPSVGGPRELGMLFSVEELARDFAGFEVHLLAEEETDLAEGRFHQGRASVVRFVGQRSS
jgi:SAM-dependent methyltransferase